MPVGVDIAKKVFQVHHVDEETGEIVNKPIKRAEFLAYFANRAIEQMKKRRPLNVVIVALADKMARTIWAILAHGCSYRSGYVGARPV